MQKSEWKENFGVRKSIRREWRPGLNVLQYDFGAMEPREPVTMKTGIILAADGGYEGDQAAHDLGHVAGLAAAHKNGLLLVRAITDMRRPDRCVSAPFCGIAWPALRRLIRRHGGAAIIENMLDEAGGRRCFTRAAIDAMEPTSPAMLTTSYPDWGLHNPGTARLWLYLPAALSPAEQAVADLAAKVAKGTMIPFLLRRFGR